jgi:hypothetical protein
MPAEFQLWVVSFEAEGLLVAVRVNDVTIYERRASAHMSFGEKINPLLIVGENSVAVSLGLSPWSGAGTGTATKQSPSSSEPPPQPAFALRVQRGSKGTDPGEAGILLRFDWMSGQTPLRGRQLSPVFDQTFQVAELPWAPPAWTGAPSLQLDRQALDLAVRHYADSLRNRDFDGALRLSRLKFEELARSMDLSIDGLIQSFRGYLESLAAAPDWSILVAPEPQFKLEGRSRLVRVTAPDGGAPITAVSRGQGVPFDVTLSFINGSWCIVR